MGKSRIIYQQWIVELGRDPSMSWQEAAELGGEHNRKKVRAVNYALSQLTSDEAAFIRSFYFQGMGYREISELTGKRISRLENIHGRAITKLRNRLGIILGLHREPIMNRADSSCALCNHEARNEIDRLIKDKKPSDTWRSIIQIVRIRYGLRISTPQVLIGHMKYHTL